MYSSEECEKAQLSVSSSFFLWFFHFQAMTLLEQLEEVRSQAEACLSRASSAQDIKNGVSAVANISLPPSAKYRYIAAETMLIENSAGSNKKEVRVNSHFLLQQCKVES